MRLIRLGRQKQQLPRSCQLLQVLQAATGDGQAQRSATPRTHLHGASHRHRHAHQLIPATKCCGTTRAMLAILCKLPHAKQCILCDQSMHVLAAKQAEPNPCLCLHALKHATRSPHIPVRHSIKNPVLGFPLTRTALSPNGSAHPCSRNAPSQPNAMAVRSSVPRLPGSWMRSRASRRCTRTPGQAPAPFGVRELLRLKV